MIQGFYITTEDVQAEATWPNGWEGLIKKDTPIALIYFDETGMEFIDGEELFGNFAGTIRKEFRIPKPCPIVSAGSCPHCGKIIPCNKKDLDYHMDNDTNCQRVRERVMKE
jgi:hypothetical protein